MIKRSKVNRKRKNNNNQKNAPKMMLSKNINLMKSAGTSVNLLYPISVWTYTVSSNFSFANGADTRVLAYSLILANSAPFNQFVNVYSEFRIVGASAIICPIANAGAAIAVNTPMLYVTTDPQGGTGNPTNGTVITNQTAHLFTAVQNMPRSVGFTFPGIGSNFGIWQDVTASPTGAFYIGCNTQVFGQNNKIFDGNLQLRVQFRTLKSN